jgi:cytidylate kinase
MKQIAIDGDSASGKTTIGKILAKRLNFTFIDSGLFYRAATYIIIKNRAQAKKTKWVNLILGNKITLKNNSIHINDRKIEEALLHSNDVNNLVSPVSTIPEIRKFITHTLQEIANNKSVVMTGRDIGTVVLKNAFLKIYLTATIEVRAERRFKELLEKETKTSFEEILGNLKNRDVIDSTREDSPLSIANDAFVIDTTSIDEEETIQKILLFMKGKEHAL